MMLDSSSGKILSTKPVEPSISSNVDTNVTTSTTPALVDAPLASTEKDSKEHPRKSEAEVRLVVRFLVEEHIVFNGKVEQVKHLDKTELSRIVSRIEWKTKEGDKPAIENERNVEDVENTGWIEENSELNNCCEPTTEISPPQSDAPSPQHKDIDKFKLIEVGSRDDLREPPYSTTIDTSSSPDAVVPNDNEVRTRSNDEHLVEDVRDNNDFECDNETNAFISKDTCETKDQQTESSYTIKKDHEQHQVQDVGQVLSERDDGDHSSLEQISQADYSSDVSQMIVDTINDCVLNVELESRRNEQLNGPSDYENIRGAEKDGLEGVTVKLEQTQTVCSEDGNRTQHNDTSNASTKEHVDEIDKKPLVDAANIPPNDVSTQDKIPKDTNIIHHVEKDAQTNEAGKNDLNPKSVPNRKTDNNVSSSSRRKNTSDISTASKRICRVSSKDQQRNNRGTSRANENMIKRREKAIDSGPVVEQARGYFTCQSKILAKWSDNHFYPGTIAKQKGDRKFEVMFYDGARKDVAETDLIPVCNILGKQVRISIAEGYCVNAIVLDQLSSTAEPFFDVEYQQNGLVKKRVPLIDIFLTADQGIPLINQPIKPDKNPDESMFAGVDLDNIVHVKRSRRLQEMEDFESTEEPSGDAAASINGAGGRRKRGQYNMRNVTNRVRTSSKTEALVVGERVTKRSLSDVNNQDTPASSCSPDTLKTNLDSSTSNSPSESSSSRETNKF